MNEMKVAEMTAYLQKVTAFYALGKRGRRAGEAHSLRGVEMAGQPIEEDRSSPVS